MLEFLGGIFMAFGGNIPGVSGGTIAFLMGFYDRLIDSINAFVSRIGADAKKKRLKALFFLLRLCAGYAIGLIGGALLVNRVFVPYIYHVSSLFLGITFASVPLVVYEERETLKGRWQNALWALPGCALIVGITLLSKAGLFDGSSPLGQALLGFPAGLLAACAMIVPGVSGAAIFYIFGLYLPINNAIESVVRFDFSVWPLVLSVFCGAVLGLLCVIKGVKWLLSHKRKQTVYAILGLMLGSLYSIWVGPETLKDPQPALSLSNFSVLFFIVGVLIIAAFALLKDVVRRKKEAAACAQRDDGGNEQE